MTFLLPLTLEITNTRILYLHLMFSLRLNFFIKSLWVYLGESLVTHVNDDKLPSSELMLFCCTFNVPLCRNFLHVKVLCEKFFVALHFVSYLSCSKLTCFAFPYCSEVDLCVIVSFFCMSKFCCVEAFQTFSLDFSFFT